MPKQGSKQNIFIVSYFDKYFKHFDKKLAKQHFLYII